MKKFFTLALVLFSLVSFSQSTTIVISQFYGAGGNTGATLNADFVELHNISTVSQSLNGLSIQYASATNTGTWTGVSALPNASIPPGGYYLIQMSGTGANGAPLPTPDYVSNPTIAMSGTNGKVALVTGTTALTSTGTGCPLPTTAVIDFVGYGTANCGETAPTAPLTPTDAGKRKNNGCTETDNNSTDFEVLVVAPRNSASPVFLCTGTPTPTITAGTLVDFGNINVGSNSTSQSFNISGVNLTGAPGVITITSPSTHFLVSNDNTTWGASTTIAFSSATLGATPVYVQFTPQAAGPQSGNITITGGGVTTAVTVTVSGNGVAVSGPNISTGVLTAFGNVCVNTTVGPNSFTISGTNLTAADITIGALSGYTYSTTSGGTYTSTLTITHAPGAVSQDVFVKFTPTAILSYNGNILVNGGGIVNAVNVPASGEGVNATPSLTTGSASGITTTGATLGGSVTSIGCSAVSAYGIEFSTTINFPNGTGTQVPSSNLAAGSFTSALSALSPSTTYYYKAYATNAGGTAYGSQQSFTTAAPPPPALSATNLTGFGDVCINSTSAPNSFDLSGVNLTTGNITVGPLNGYAFGTAAAGPFTPTLTLTPTGATFNGTVYVTFTPLAEINYSGNITAGGAGAPNLIIPVTGAGIISTPIVVTGDSSLFLPNEVSASGTIADPGCTAVIAYGIEYSGVNGFANGTGKKVPAATLNGSTFTSRLTGLIQNTAYYYKAYATNTGGIAYGAQKVFFSKAIPAGLVIYGTPIIRGTNLHYSLSGIKPGHYSVKIFNSVGQRILQREQIIQVSFIDDNFSLPATLPIGMYIMEIHNYEFNIQKAFMVQ